MVPMSFSSSGACRSLLEIVQINNDLYRFLGKPLPLNENEFFIKNRYFSTVIPETRVYNWRNKIYRIK